MLLGAIFLSACEGLVEFVERVRVSVPNSVSVILDRFKNFYIQNSSVETDRVYKIF